MKYITKIRLITFYLTALFYSNIQAQPSANSVDDKAVEILDKAIGDVIASENFSIYFEGIALDVKKPEDIFKMPVYQVFRGGYLFVNKGKHEIKTGYMNSLCDGKLVVVTEESSQTMFVDSVSTDTIQDIMKNPQFDEFMKEYVTEGTIKYEGIVDINNHKCHKIRSDIKNTMGGAHVLYWVDVKTGMLYLMAEYQNSSYTVYWINKVGKAPTKNSYTIYLPAKKLTTYHGYKVLDNRFGDVE